MKYNSSGRTSDLDFVLNLHSDVSILTSTQKTSGNDPDKNFAEVKAFLSQEATDTKAARTVQHSPHRMLVPLQ